MKLVNIYATNFQQKCELVHKLRPQHRFPKIVIAIHKDDLEVAFLNAFVENPEAVTIPIQALNLIRPFIAKQKQAAIQRILLNDLL